MRTLFFSLLVFNVLFFLWHFMVSSEGVDHAALAKKKIAASHVDAPRLQLVSDMAEESIKRAPDKGSENDPKVPTFTAGEKCWLIGPFDEIDVAQDTQTRLKATSVNLTIRRLATPVTPDYWVHVVPQVSRQAAVKLLRDLQARDIDSFIVTEGEQANGISLGFFSNEKLARKTQKQHADQSYKVDVQVVPREIEEYWGIMRVKEYQKMSKQAWSRFRSGNGDLELSQNYCDVVASKGKLE